MDDALYEVDSDIAARQAAMVRSLARLPPNDTSGDEDTFIRAAYPRFRGH